jgi:hypothetical protein
MAKKKITIDVKGFVGTGKSRISAIIYDALKTHGFNVTHDQVEKPVTLKDKDGHFFTEDLVKVVEINLTETYDYRKF